MQNSTGGACLTLTGDTYFDCLKCPKTFKHTVALYRHVLNFHTSAFCYKCNTSYQSLRNLIRHDRRMHLEMVIPCPHCGALFKNAIYLKKHMHNRHSKDSYVKQYYRIFKKYYMLCTGTVSRAIRYNLQYT